VLVVELRDDTEFADAARAVGGALNGHGLKQAYGAVGASAETVLDAVRGRDGPPPGWTVENVGGARQWVVRDPAGRQVGAGWSKHAEAVREAWADSDGNRRFGFDDVKRLDVQPGDTLVITTDGWIGRAAWDEMQQKFAVEFGGTVRFMVLEGGARLEGVIGGLPERPHGQAT
jgi:hypothetical protein